MLILQEPGVYSSASSVLHTLGSLANLACWFAIPRSLLAKLRLVMEAKLHASSYFSGFENAFLSILELYAVTKSLKMQRT
eukprot:5821489-Amphidinium_carterae.1